MSSTLQAERWSHREALGMQEGCCNCVEIGSQSLPWKCFYRETAVCSHSIEASLGISVKGKKLFQCQASDTDARECGSGSCIVHLEE